MEMVLSECGGQWRDTGRCKLGCKSQSMLMMEEGSSL